MGWEAATAAMGWKERAVMTNAVETAVVMAAGTAAAPFQPQGCHTPYKVPGSPCSGS